MDDTPFVCELHVWNDSLGKKNPKVFVGSDACKMGLVICELFPDFSFRIHVRKDERIFFRNQRFEIPEYKDKDEYLFSQIPPGQYIKNYVGSYHSEKYGVTKKIDIKRHDGLSFRVWCPPCLSELLHFCAENNICGTEIFIKS